MIIEILRKLRNPSFDKFNELLESSIYIIEEQRSSLDITGNLIKLGEKGKAVIIGDLHGDIFSLNNIIRESKLENKLICNNNYLICLGDYIDKGPHQIHVLFKLMKLLEKYPKKVILLKGNHEGPSDIPVSPHDYPLKLRRLYGEKYEELYLKSIKLFKSLYTACMIENQAIFLHGGVPSEVNNLSDIAFADMKHPEKDILKEILWNDPSSLDGWRASSRGIGKNFGYNITSEFLKKIGVRMLIRGHECYEKGYHFHKDKILTLFSCKLPIYGNIYAAYVSIRLDIDFTQVNLLQNIHQF